MANTLAVVIFMVVVSMILLVSIEMRSRRKTRLAREAETLNEPVGDTAKVVDRDARQ
jgi:hypothetical protein